MKIYIERIPEEGLLLEGEKSPDILQIQNDREKFEENIQIEVRAFRVSGNLIVVGRIATHVELICSNCLENFEFSIENEQFSYDCEILGRDVIDITDPIREEIIMGLPLRPLCRENCKGLCSQCGQNLNLGSCHCKKPKKKGKTTQGSPFDVLDQLKPKKL